MSPRPALLLAAIFVASCAGTASAPPSVGTPAPATASPPSSPSATTISSPSISPPAAATWTVVGKLRTGRSQHTATLLQDGRVLVVGGIGPDKPLDGGVTAGDVLATVELYDPLLRIWRPGHSMSTPRLGHIAILLLDGRVLVAGGMDTAPVPGCDTSSCNLAMTSAELYDPTTNTWRRTGSMHKRRNNPAVARLEDGRVLVESDGTAELYDPVAGTWAVTGSLARLAYGGDATLLPDGTVLLSSGGDGSGVELPSERYDPSTGHWSEVGAMPRQINGHAVRLAEGRVLAVGQDGAVTFDPQTDTWRSTGSMVHAGQIDGAALLPDGRVLIMGTIDPYYSGVTDPVQLYDPASDTWRAVPGPSHAHPGSTVTTLSDGSVLVAGGYDGRGLADLYTPGG